MDIRNRAVERLYNQELSIERCDGLDDITI
jgi:hypothetical protein